MARITRMDLERLCQRLNAMTNSPEEPYSLHSDGRHVANVGNYHLSGAYGGWCIHRMVNTGGGVSEPIFSGHRPAREVYELTHEFLRGLSANN